jgi:hypothetical protein
MRRPPQAGGTSLLSTEEIFLSSKRNIEGFAVLANHFLPILIQSSLNSALINIDEMAATQKKRPPVGAPDIFYKSTVAFKESLTRMIGKQFPDVKTISVAVDFTKL